MHGQQPCTQDAITMQVAPSHKVTPLLQESKFAPREHLCKTKSTFRSRDTFAQPRTPLYQKNTFAQLGSTLDYNITFVQPGAPSQQHSEFKIPRNILTHSP